MRSKPTILQVLSLRSNSPNRIVHSNVKRVVAPSSSQRQVGLENAQELDSFYTSQLKVPVGATHTTAAPSQSCSFSLYRGQLHGLTGVLGIRDQGSCASTVSMNDESLIP
ncbi:hypothetical protein BV20DRAFT_662995 [Pilatotrama ljubarskyi]|nr:hypothetical protein BV20DRAFT_662995 [Pilatotrama ljubarskyi]